MILPEYFHYTELNCKCCGGEPDSRSIEMLYAVRLIYNKPIIITSGFRCPAYNKKVGKAKNSAHLQGAFDCKIPKEDEFRFIQIAMAVGFTGIGIKDNSFVHLDRFHESPTVWTY